MHCSTYFSLSIILTCCLQRALHTTQVPKYTQILHCAGNRTDEHAKRDYEQVKLQLLRRVSIALSVTKVITLLWKCLGLPSIRDTTYTHLYRFFYKKKSVHNVSHIKHFLGGNTLMMPHIAWLQS